jgi:hypothetical protein
MEAELAAHGLGTGDVSRHRRASAFDPFLVLPFLVLPFLGLDVTRAHSTADHAVEADEDRDPSPKPEGRGKAALCQPMSV